MSKRVVLRARMGLDINTGRVWRRWERKRLAVLLRIARYARGLMMRRQRDATKLANVERPSRPPAAPRSRRGDMKRLTIWSFAKKERAVLIGVLPLSHLSVGRLTLVLDRSRASLPDLHDKGGWALVRHGGSRGFWATQWSEYPERQLTKPVMVLALEKLRYWIVRKKL